MKTLEVIDGTIQLILESIPDVQARDYTARCLQDSFGAPASQAERILTLLEFPNEQPTG